jgi:hypothetical protein
MVDHRSDQIWSILCNYHSQQTCHYNTQIVKPATSNRLAQACKTGRWINLQYMYCAVAALQYLSINATRCTLLLHIILKLHAHAWTQGIITVVRLEERDINSVHLCKYLNPCLEGNRLWFCGVDAAFTCQFYFVITSYISSVLLHVVFWQLLTGHWAWDLSMEVT